MNQEESKSSSPSPVRRTSIRERHSTSRWANMNESPQPPESKLNEESKSSSPSPVRRTPIPEQPRTSRWANINESPEPLTFTISRRRQSVPISRMTMENLPSSSRRERIQRSPTPPSASSTDLSRLRESIMNQDMMESKSPPPQSDVRPPSPRPQLRVYESLRGFENPENISRILPIRSYSARSGSNIFDENLIPMILSYGSYDPDIHTVEEMIESGNLVGLKYLIDIGENIYQNSSNEHPLVLATRYGHLNIFRYLVEEQKIDMNMGEQPETAMNILGHASRFAHLDIVQYILENGGIELTSLDSLKKAIKVASQFNHPHIVKYLVEFTRRKYGNDSVSDESFKTSTQYSRQSSDDLEKAVIENDIDMVEFLLGTGVDPNRKMSQYKILPLEYAILIGNVRLVKLLLKYNPDVPTQRHFQMAVKKKNPESYQIIKLLLKNGLSIIPDNLRYAIELQNVKLVKLLLKYGADPDVDNLSLAIKKGNVEIIELLFKYSKLTPQEKVALLNTKMRY